jgi:hypothetical protein
MAIISDSARRRLAIQGFENVDRETLAEAAPWLRLAFALCTLLAAAGTVAASPFVLWSLVPIAVLAAAFPVHPFDLLYNRGIRHLTGAPVLPTRGAPSRFACGVGAFWLAAAAFAFQSGATAVGYALGGMLACVGLLVTTTDICVPSMIYRAVFGFPDEYTR